MCEVVTKKSDVRTNYSQHQMCELTTTNIRCASTITSLHQMCEDSEVKVRCAKLAIKYTTYFRCAKISRAFTNCADITWFLYECATTFPAFSPSAHPSVLRTSDSYKCANWSRIMSFVRFERTVSSDVRSTPSDVRSTPRRLFDRACFAIPQLPQLPQPSSPT